MRDEDKTKEQVITELARLRQRIVSLEKQQSEDEQVKESLIHPQEKTIQTEKIISVKKLAAGMAHEMNNHFAGILQGIQVLQNRISPQLGKNRQTAEEIGVPLEKINTYLEKRGIPEFLQNIRESGNRGANVVNHMLQFSRGSHSQKEWTSLSHLIGQVVALAASDDELKQPYDFQKIKIIQELDPTCFEIFCLKAEIEQVFLHLIRNATQALCDPPNPYEMQDSPQINIRTEKKNKAIGIEIEDNGPGMDEETRQRIFEPFFSTKEVGKGIGLGLSIAYFIVTEYHQGTMVVESIPGKGTKFIVTLPDTEQPHLNAH